MPVATIDPARQVRVRMSVPGNTSISHRDGLLAELAGELERWSCNAPAAGCGSTRAALRNLGMSIICDGGATALMGRGSPGLRSAASTTASALGTTVHRVRGIPLRQPVSSAGSVAIRYPGSDNLAERLAA